MRSKRLSAGLGTGVLLLAIVATTPKAAQAQATGQPPPVECIGRGTGKTAAQCTALGGPLWKDVEFDCITGDHWISGNNATCTGQPASSGPPGNYCNQPDIIVPEEGDPWRCDQWDRDLWERPYSHNSAYFAYDDIVYNMISDDGEWFYFLIQLYGLQPAGKLEAFYGVEFDADPAVVSPCGPDGRRGASFSQHWDDSPCPPPAAGSDPDFPAGASCTDWFLRSTSPTANIFEKVGYNRWSREQVVAWYDTDEDNGGLHCAAGDDNWSGSGMETSVNLTGGTGNWMDGLYAAMPSNCGTMAPGGWQDELLGIDPSKIGTISFNGTCVILAARKDMIAAHLTVPRTPRSSNPSLPTNYGFAWRSWAVKGVQDNQNVELHDKYNNQESGDSYRDQTYYPLSGVAEGDNSGPLGGLSYFGPENIVIIKDVLPDEAGNEWAKFRFDITGPTTEVAFLQDPAVAPSYPGFGSPPWEHPSQVVQPVRPTQIFGGTYQITESTGPDSSTALEEYTVSWVCKNADKTPNTACDPNGLIFDFDLCQAVPVPTACSSNADWTTDGVVEGSCGAGVPSCATTTFPVCTGATVICKFTNSAGTSEEVCLEAITAAGDLQVIGGVQPQQVSFTTAAVSVPDADSTDSIFLASFMPIPDESRWPGTVDHFIAPLPVVEDADGNLVPDKSQVCSANKVEACLAWDAQVQVLTQAPDSTEVVSNRRIGIDGTERRVTYTQETSPGVVPLAIRKFDYSDSDDLAIEKDLWRGMGIDWHETDPPDTVAEAGARDQARIVIRKTLEQHTATLVDADTLAETTVTYALGDFFHATPVLLGGPANFTYLANDLEGNGQACNVTGSNANRGYRCFFEKQRRRRKVLLAPSNDGQLHAFDAGFYSGSVVNQRLIGDFDLGTGKELFAHIPRPMLAHTRNMATLEHAFGIDGGIQTDDVFIDAAHAGTPVVTDREWRSVVLGSYRDGGRGIFALDLTAPDPVEARTVRNFGGQNDLEWVPVKGTDYVPVCSTFDDTPPSGCAGAYPSVLWEFEDKCIVSGISAACDQDGNGQPDLAFSWSKVNTGRILVLPSGVTNPALAVVKFVAIFGGGLDPGNVDSGNFLYMVDIETGKTLWKRSVLGPVPSEPAAVDTDRNGIIDTLYVGTTTGLMYKVDLSAAGPISSTTGRVDDPNVWAPFAIFDTGGREIFFPPSVLFEATSGHYALAFGTGDRKDLWSETISGEEGRFYVILDQNFRQGVFPLAGGPLDESDFQRILAGDPAVGGNLLTAPTGSNRPGWVLLLGPDERVVNDALAVGGLLVFPTFDPDRPEVCTFEGSGNLYALFTASADALGGIDEARATPVEGFASEAVVTPSGFSQQSGQGETVDPFEEVAQMQSIRESLMTLMPSDCRFGNFSLNVSTSLSSREVLPIAQIPVCIARKNWTEPF